MDADAPAARPAAGRTAPELPPAAYLCHPVGAAAALRDQREALEHFAHRLGLPGPVFYVDRGRPGPGPAADRPRLQALVHAAQAGSHRLLLIPGPWVLADCEAELRACVRRLTGAGCERILRLPARRALVRVGRGRRNAGPAWAPARAVRLG
ncbi:recombinase family protein [Kitasatospora sp. NPDC058965]|uniref:recombinase family protein n=1 Tax=Kitasatospora sp. NPDC058965 TaxID=3346682 RepID=UPI003697EE4B